MEQEDSLLETESKARDEPLLSMESELWNIFTEYNLRANSVEAPDRMGLGAFRSLCKDCKILSTSTASADYQLAFSAEVAKQQNVSSRKTATLGFSGFVEALMRLSLKKYPSKPFQEALELVLTESIVPNAKRPEPLSERVRDAFAQYYREFEQIRSEFEPSLTELLFPYYWSSNGVSGRAGAQVRGKVPSPTKAGSSQQVSYETFLHFAQDFNLLSSGLLTTYQLGEIYLWAVAEGAARTGDELPRLNFDGIWLGLVRCALTAFEQVEVTPYDKIKGLLTHMWQAIQKTARDEDDAAPINGSQNMMHALKFKAKVTLMWQMDGYRDYLTPQYAAQPSARLLLKGIPSPNREQGGSSSSVKTPQKSSLPSTRASTPPGSIETKAS